MPTPTPTGTATCKAMADESDTNETEGHTQARVREVYDQIATHFSKTRAYPWPEVEAFVAEYASGSVGLDVGCGNGRHTELLVESCDRVVGVDVSRGLLAEAHTRLGGSVGNERVTWVQADAAALPLGEAVVDTAVYVATLHHLPDRETRVRSLSELARALAPGGTALVNAWSTAHDRFDADPGAEEGFDTTLDWTLPGGETVERFYHIYAPAEFERDLRESGLAVESVEVSSGNCYARVGGKS